MTRSSFAVLVVGVSVAAAGCMPLEQAPLVYSSKQQMGVGVAVGTPDSPGFDVNIGYKGLDAAFVPVAVAKKCESASACAAVNYNVQIVKGGNELTGLSAIDARLLAGTQQQLVQIDTDRKTLGKTLAEKQSQLALLQAVPAAQKGIAALMADDDNDASTQRVLSADQTQQLNDLRAKVNAAPKIDAANLQSDVNALIQEDARKAGEAERLKGIEDRLVRQQRRSSGDRKDDALSVYGSFGGNANGEAGKEKAGAGLTLGKVFSTGIAAQNVSQGIRNAAKLSAAGECMDRAKLLIGASQDKDVLAAALAACKPAPDEPDQAP